MDKNRSKTKHGEANTKLYKVWSRMKSTCLTSSATHYKYYGGRGITICNKWDKFKNFSKWAYKNGYKVGLTIDRKENNKGYSPSNCRWVDRITQARNRNKRHSKTTSQYVGVSWYPNRVKPWMSYITVNKKRINLGYYKTELKAARIRSAYIKEHNLKNFNTNGV